MSTSAATSSATPDRMAEYLASPLGRWMEIRQAALYCLERGDDPVDVIENVMRDAGDLRVEATRS